MNAFRNVGLAVNTLKEKAQRASSAIQRHEKEKDKEIPVKIWPQIFDSIIFPITLYGSEIRGSLSNTQ